MKNKLFVGGISWSVDDDELRRHFGQFGAIVDARVIRDRETGRSRGLGLSRLRVPTMRPWRSVSLMALSTPGGLSASMKQKSVGLNATTRMAETIRGRVADPIGTSVIASTGRIAALLPRSLQ